MNITIADGSDFTKGSQADAVWVGGSGSVISLLKALVPQYATEFDYDANGNVIYYGIAQPGSAVSSGSWQIRKLDYDGAGNLLDMLYANGARAFNQAWTSRAGLSYS